MQRTTVAGLIIGAVVLVLIGVVIGLIAYGDKRCSEVVGYEVEFSDVTMTGSGELALGYEVHHGEFSLGIRYYWLVPGGRVMMRLPGSDMMMNMDVINDDDGDGSH